MAPKDIVRIAAIGDLHYGRTTPHGSLQPLFSQIAESADILALCGDITDYGLADEARAFVKDVGATMKIPAVAVLGNHDFESNQQAEIAKILNDAGIVTLDGDTTEIHGIGFAGVKGFAGGFGRRALGPWGEDIVKRFVHEAVNEALKLESALARLRTDRLVVLLHYSPILATVEGEPCDIYPFLGCSRLEEPLTRFPVDVVFHGHAHHGRAEGRTRTQVPVFNVSMSLMRELSPDKPFKLVEVGVAVRAEDRRTGADRRGTEVH
ncbi:MAG: metallophosphoesterase family protein [Vicinamibacterales bacterium]